MSNMGSKGSEKTWKILKIEPENHDTTSLYLEGYDDRLANRRAGQWASIRGGSPLKRRACLPPRYRS